MNPYPAPERRRLHCSPGFLLPNPHNMCILDMGILHILCQLFTLLMMLT